MDNAPNTDDNNDGGSTTLTKMKNTSSVIQHKIQSVVIELILTFCAQFATLNMNIVWG